MDASNLYQAFLSILLYLLAGSPNSDSRLVITFVTVTSVSPS